MVNKTYFDKYLNTKVHKLTILEYFLSDAPNKQGKRRTLFKCICECGNERTVPAYQVIPGKIKSCKSCSNVRKPRLSDKDRKIRKDDIKVYMQEYRKVHKVKLAERKRDDAINAKEEGLLHYGGKCTCCGEAIKEFLTMEHINGRDKEKVRLTGRSAWLDAKRKGWPTDITVLCFNCNCAKGIYGKCPHNK